MLFVLAAAIGAPTFGPLAALPVLPGLALFWVQQARLDRFRRPELALLSCLAVLQLGLGASLALAHGPRIYLLPIMIMPVLLASVVFPARIATLVVIFSTQIMLVVALVFDLDAVRNEPFALFYPLVVMIAGAGIAMVVAGLDVSTRGAAIVDPLTELPNRIALRARVAELEHQSRVNCRPIALIVGDPDRFKLVNDRRGHATGDAVLRELAARMRAGLPGAASAYRLGGEEFVVLMSDADAGSGAALAEQLRRRVGARAIEGLGIAVSFGVAASDPGEPFDFSQLFGFADRALYEAKRAGGDRVRMWPLAAPDAVSTNGGPGHAGADASLQIERLEREFEHRDGSEHEDPVVHEESRPQTGYDEPSDRWEHWNEQEHAATGNWLVRDDVQRRQLLDLNRALREKAKAAFLLGFALGGVSAIQYGWQILVAPAIMATIYVLVEHHIERFKHPEYALGLGWIGLQTSFLVSGLAANAPMVFAFPLLLVLLIGSSAVFPPRGVVVGVALTVLITITVGVAEAPDLVREAPGILAFYVALVVSIGMLGATIGRSTIEYRDLGIVDQLTGLFNRGALVSRVAELAHRPARQTAAVAVVVADVDRFKAINDSYGHATGDAVLREIGYRVRKNLRAFESAYRIGGEEFVILLDDVDWRHAEQVALRLREAISKEPMAGVRTTVSFGLAATKPGEAFDYDALFKSADSALYAAKRAGGDNVFAGEGVMLSGALTEAHAAPVQVGPASQPPVQTSA